MGWHARTQRANKKKNKTFPCVVFWAQKHKFSTQNSKRTQTKSKPAKTETGTRLRRRERPRDRKRERERDSTGSNTTPSSSSSSTSVLLSSLSSTAESGRPNDYPIRYDPDQKPNRELSWPPSIPSTLSVSNETRTRLDAARRKSQKIK